jgi:invasion protein IalB
MAIAKAMAVAVAVTCLCTTTRAAAKIAAEAAPTNFAPIGVPASRRPADWTLVLAALHSSRRSCSLRQRINTLIR